MTSTVAATHARHEPAHALPLLQPFQMQDLTLRNRVMMPALTRCRADNPGLVPNELMARYYAQRASAGIIVSEGTWVGTSGIGINSVPGANRALNERWADLVAFGRGFIANPDLVERFRDGQQPNEVDKSTAYTTGPRGYTDYPLVADGVAT